MPLSQPKVVVIGAGPAGLMAAIQAARAGARVALVEQLTRAGAKLLATGGGRCNLTNTLPQADFVARFGRQGRFMLPALHALDSHALCRFLDERGVPTASPDGFHVFPTSNQASDVLAALLRECATLGVELRRGSKAVGLCLANAAVTGVALDGETLPCDRVVVAAGGKSYANLGGTGGGYALADQAGHAIVPPVPALAALDTREAWPGECAGITMPAVRLCIDLPAHRRRAREGDLLFTHTGLSGPAAIDLAGDVAQLLEERESAPLRLQLLPEVSEAAWRERFERWRRDSGRKHLRNLLSRHLPQKLADVACAQAGAVANVRAAELPKKAMNALAAWLAAAPLTATATAGFDKAMATRGGVALKQVNPKTLQSKLVAGLYFAGEVLDLDGPCGGYNLQWAFSSGYLAGCSCARRGEDA